MKNRFLSLLITLIMVLAQEATILRVFTEGLPTPILCSLRQ